jgi:hypothetical protein
MGCLNAEEERGVLERIMLVERRGGDICINERRVAEEKFACPGFVFSSYPISMSKVVVLFSKKKFV